MKKLVLFSASLLLFFSACDTQESQNTEYTDSIPTEEEAVNTPDTPGDEDQAGSNESPQSEEGQATYHNDRFNFCVTYPRNTFQLDKASQNNDGKSFTSMDGFEMEAYGRNQTTTDETLEDAFEFEKKGESSKKITYSTKGDNWFVVSGTEDGYIFYSKTYLIEDQFVTLDFTYPLEEKSKFERVMKEILNHFPGCSSQKRSNVKGT